MTLRDGIKVGIGFAVGGALVHWVTWIVVQVLSILFSGGRGVAA